ADRRRSRLVPAAVALLLLSACAGGAPAESARPSPVSTTPTTAAPSPEAAPTTPTRQPTPHEPEPTAAAAPEPTAAAAPEPSAAPAPEPLRPVLAESAPVAVRIPAAGAASELLHLGLRPDGSLEVPPTHPGAPASWYTASPTPGERGPAILLGHVNAT